MLTTESDKTSCNTLAWIEIPVDGAAFDVGIIIDDIALAHLNSDFVVYLYLGRTISNYWNMLPSHPIFVLHYVLTQVFIHIIWILSQLFIDSVVKIPISDLYVVNMGEIEISDPLGRHVRKSFWQVRLPQSPIHESRLQLLALLLSTLVQLLHHICWVIQFLFELCEQSACISFTEFEKLGQVRFETLIKLVDILLDHFFGLHVLGIGIDEMARLFQAVDYWTRGVLIPSLQIVLKALNLLNLDLGNEALFLFWQAIQKLVFVVNIGQAFGLKLEHFIAFFGKFHNWLLVNFL